MCALCSGVSTAGQHAIAALRDPPLAPLAQLDRALPSEGRGQRFESSRVRQSFYLFLKHVAFRNGVKRHRLQPPSKLWLLHGSLPIISSRPLGRPVGSALTTEYRKGKVFYVRIEVDWFETQSTPAFGLRQLRGPTAVLYIKRPYWIAGVPPRQALAIRPR